MRKALSWIFMIAFFVVIVGVAVFFIQLDKEVFETTVTDDSIIVVGHDYTFEISMEDIESAELQKGYFIADSAERYFYNSMIVLAHDDAGNLFLVFVDPTYTIKLHMKDGTQCLINQSTDEETLGLFHLISSTTEEC